VPRSVGLPGNVIFGAAAIVVLVFAHRAERRRAAMRDVDVGVASLSTE
jgi:hypothetical protein